MSNAVEKNSWQVLSYLELWHRYERATGGQNNEEALDRKSRGDSKPPVTEVVLDLMHANRKVTGALDAAILSVSMAKRKLPGGEYPWQVLNAVRQDPGEVRRRRAEDGRQWLALRCVCLMVAIRLAEQVRDENGPLEIRVSTDPKDAEADNPVQARNRELNRRKSVKAQAAYELIYPRYKEFRATVPEATDNAAIELFCEHHAEETKYPISPSKVRRAIKHCESEVA